MPVICSSASAINAMAESRVPRKPMPTAPSELEQQQEQEKCRKRQRAKERKASSELPK
jgi:hypothetical protein